ncbi:hypothetical protein LTR04_005309 [Oleoguttula sp. CCFEE 6159]|nr:hypothetical protein LTR04_005309 [Oleoguttula sp. CCFEE 6159]
MSSLLESMLKEKGTEPPPANHPPKTTRGGSTGNDETSPIGVTLPRNPLVYENLGQEYSSPGSQLDDPAEGSPVYDDNSGQLIGDASAGSPQSILASPKKEGLLSGRLRYFGPTTNCHVHSEFDMIMEDTQESLEQARRAERIIRTLSLETQDYLMDMFWQHYNSVLHIVHKDAFHEDRENGRSQFYSGFLHICILAMGYRCADKSRPDMQRISLPQRESTLHREAKYMLDCELERSGGIPSVAALLLLGDLECGVGRDNLGWMYSGMAVRLCFDIGLHLDSRLSGLPECEVEIRHMTLWACVVYDKYWALFLGRPTSMKSTDLEIYNLTKQFERLGSCKPAGPQKSLETQIYEALLDLMELAGKITENIDPRSQSAVNIDRNGYLRMAALDRELGAWYARLPEPLKWTTANINTAPFSFFLLHQQYHSALILLHRPFAMYDDPNSSDSEEITRLDNHFSALSRTVCTKHAITVVRIFWQHRQRFDTRQIFVTGLQHAGTAATALVAALAFLKDSSDRSNNMQYLECLAAALQDMAYTYQPAERMSTVLQAVMIELRGGSFSSVLRLDPSYSAVVPARRGSSNDEVMRPSLKRRHTNQFNRHLGVPTNKGFIGEANMNINIPQRAAKPVPDMNRQDDFVMVTPRSELSSWPNITTDTFLQQTMPPTPASTDRSLPTVPRMSRSTAWMGAEAEEPEVSFLDSIQLPSIPSVSDVENTQPFDLLTLPNDEDWRNWHSSGGIGLQNDLDGFPPRGQYSGAFSNSAGRYG